MNKHSLSAIVLLIACFISACSNNLDEELALSREASKQLGAQLKNKLVTALQSGGPETAISVCNIEAIKITESISNKKNNLEVGRTSLKIRNPANKPDAWETKQLEWFHSQQASGIDVKTLEKSEIVKENGKKIFRYMKAIPIQEPCMLCHGEVLSTAVKEKISDLYPQDQATGYKPGQIRGAFTIKKEL